MAGLTRWDPFRDLVALQDEMNRLFEDRARRGNPETTLARFAPPSTSSRTRRVSPWSADLPGLEPRDVDVKVEDGTLTLSGLRKLEREEKRDNYHRVERTYGTFARSFTLPPTVNVESIKAEHKNGVLRVFLPRREESKPRKISVKVD